MDFSFSSDSSGVQSGVDTVKTPSFIFFPPFSSVNGSSFPAENQLVFHYGEQVKGISCTDLKLMKDPAVTSRIPVQRDKLVATSK